MIIHAIPFIHWVIYQYYARNKGLYGLVHWKTVSFCKLNNMTNSSIGNCFVRKFLQRDRYFSDVFCKHWVDYVFFTSKNQMNYGGIVVLTERNPQRDRSFIVRFQYTIALFFGKSWIQHRKIAIESSYTNINAIIIALDNLQ